MTGNAAPDAGESLWPVIAGRPVAGRAIDPVLLRRLAMMTSPGLAAWLLDVSQGDGEPATGPLAADPDVDEIHRSRLLNRYRLANAAGWLKVLREAEIDVVVLKGLATAHRFYPDPLLRSMGDVDLLVRQRDIGALVDCLRVRGFRFYKSRSTPRWGLSSQASFHPFVAPGRGFSFDLHVQPDDFPVFRSLPAASVFDRSATVDIGGMATRIPCDDHLILLALTNAARDKFGPFALGSVIDAMVGLGHAGVSPDWTDLAAIARSGGYERALRAGVALLRALGTPAGALPAGFGERPAGLAGWSFDRMVSDFRNLFADPPGRVGLQLRDTLLISAPSILIHRHLRRLRGLIRPWPAVPS